MGYAMGDEGEPMNSSVKHSLKMRLKYGPSLSRNECVKYLLLLSAGKVNVAEDQGKAPECKSQPAKSDAGWSRDVEGCQN